MTASVPIDGGASVPIADFISQSTLEYNITFLSIEKTGRKPYSIREHIIGIVMVSERDFDNVTGVWSYNVHALEGLP